MMMLKARRTKTDDDDDDDESERENLATFARILQKIITPSLSIAASKRVWQR